MGKYIVNKTIKLEKFPGKGGWTYARLPGLKPDAKNPFGWIKVAGTIDDISIRQYHLMPMGNGELFLPVKAEIRKKIRKQAGDLVKVVLYKDEEPFTPPPEWLECLKDEPQALIFYNTLPESKQRQLVSRVYAVKSINLRADRMAAAISKLAMGRLE